MSEEVPDSDTADDIEAQIQGIEAQLQTALEKLRAAEEKLLQQDQALRATRHALESERRHFQAMFDLIPVGSRGNAGRTEEELLQLAAIVEGSGDAIFGKTLEGIITSWNRGAEQLYGYTRQEAIGQPIHLIVPLERTEELAHIFQRLQSGESVEAFETLRMHKSGARVEVSVQISPIKTPEGTIIGVSTIARDIAHRKRTEEQIRLLMGEAQARSLMLETANRVALDILANRTGVEALRHIAEAARKLSGARYAALGVARPGAADLLEFVTTGLEAEAEAAIGRRPEGHGVLGLLLQRKEPLRIDMLGEHTASVGFPAHHPAMNSFLGVPILQGETVLGSLYLTEKEGGAAFTDADEAAVQALGASAAIAIQNLHALLRQRAMIGGLINAQEAERKAIAYDLHDGLTQYVMASHAHIESFLRAYLAGKEERANVEMEHGLRYLKQAVTESRRLVNGLRTLTLDDLGLAGALEQLLMEEKVRAGWEEAEFRHNIAERHFDDTVQTAIYRVAQEALTNARKYARTSKIMVSLLLVTETESAQPQLMLGVRDWGVGFVPEEKFRESHHVGLHSMSERVFLLGGTYRLHSAPGEGTYIRAVFPALEPQEAPGDQEADTHR